jgi:hypothetical protein
MNELIENIEEFIPEQSLKDKHKEAMSLAMEKLPEQSGDERLVKESLKTLKNVRKILRITGFCVDKSHQLI